VREAGVAIIGQTGNLAPADKRFYGIRDVTGTVESIDLITASILSKKLAEGLDALVMDVKVGSGAFMPTPAKSRALAESIVRVANGAGVKTTALLTDMNQVLALSAGNAVEMAEAVAYLRGDYQDPVVHEVTLALCAEMLVSGQLASTTDAARQQLENALASGAALEAFQRMITLLGGPADFTDKAGDYLPVAPIIKPVIAERGGIVQPLQVRDIGLAVVAMGGGRTRADQVVDPAVGLTRIVRPGTQVAAGDVLAMAHVRTDDQLTDTQQRLLQAIPIADTDVTTLTAVHDRIDLDSLI
jgi:thymidine phosphorylase